MDDALAPGEEAAGAGKVIQLQVDHEGDGQRLDRWLAAQMPGHSRSEIQRWIKEGRVTVDGRAAKASQAVESGQVVQVQRLAELKPLEKLVPQALPLDIVYEDADLLAINKPAGLVVHPAPGHPDRTLVNAVLHHCPELQGIGDERRPGIVHRLDKDTSGLILVAKSLPALRALQKQFKERQVEKEYLALVEGILEPPRGRIVAPIGRHPTHRKRQAVLPPDAFGQTAGREAITEYEVLGVYTAPVQDGSARGNFSLVRVHLHTGRTHQIRVHFAWRKHPIVGDTLYGYRKQRLPLDRMFLHASRLKFRLPGNGQEIELRAELPPELQELLSQLEQAR